MLHNIHVGILERVADIKPEHIAGEFIFLAGMIYVLSELFKRGAEMQTENELTV